MTSRRQTILEAIIPILNGSGKPMGVPDARLRRPLPDTPIQTSEINVYPVTQDTEGKGGKYGPLHQNRLRVVIEVRAPSDVLTVDSILDTPLVWISQALMGSKNVGGLATDVLEVGTVWGPVYLDRIISVARVSFVIEFQTSRLNPESVS
jgi:hypothetical protein